MKGAAKKLSIFNREEFEELLALSLEEEKVKKSSLITLKGKGEKFFREKLLEKLCHYRFMNERTYLCSLYIAEMLSRYIDRIPESFFAFDFLEKYYYSSNPLFLMEGGNFCFLLCSLLPAENFHKIVPLSYYQEMGKSFYLGYYQATNKEIGALMSRYFRRMAFITSQALKEK